MRRLSLLSFALIACLLGCSGDPTGPVIGQLPPGAPSPGGDEDSSATSAVNLGTLGRLLGGLTVRVKSITGTAEAVVTNGRWRLEVPVGAIEGTATVALGLPRTSSAGCQLEIVPESQNHFDVPILLVADCSGVPDAELANYAMFWYDPDTRTWVKLTESKVDLDAKTVSVPLTHFSRYAVGPVGGKAGW